MKYILASLCLILISCNYLPTNPDLNINYGSINGASPLDSSAKSIMNGIYKVIDGKDLLGDEVAGKWIGNKWCFYSNHDVVFSENAGGSFGDSLVFAGYIRVVRSAGGSEIKLTMLPNEGGTDLITHHIKSPYILRAKDNNGNNITLQRVRDLYSPAKRFYMLAHRGGGRNSERLGHSENSVEMLKYAEIMGATGVEIDVRRTKDNQLIIFHDDTFSPRTVQGAYLLGNVENFDLAQINLFGRLINGEKIPTLAEALSAIVDNTNISLVWLDIKVAGLIDEVIKEQQEALNSAKAKGRDLLILLGVPDQGVLDQLNKSAYKTTIPILIEYDVEQVLAYPNCVAWAPRWTNGMQTADIQRVHAAGKLVFTWTLDVIDYISDFIHGDYDGILSNYPSLVAGMLYSNIK